MGKSADGRHLAMAGQKGGNIDQRGAEGGILNGRVRKGSGSHNISPTDFCYFPILCWTRTFV